MKKVYTNQFGMNAHNYMAKRLSRGPTICAEQVKDMPDDVAANHFEQGEKELGELCDSLRQEIERRNK